VTDEPVNLVRIPGKVKVAEGSTVESKSICKIKFGDMEIDAACMGSTTRTEPDFASTNSKQGIHTHSMVIQGDALTNLICPQKQRFILQDPWIKIHN
jgi:hypothetical protein